MNDDTRKQEAGHDLPEKPLHTEIVELLAQRAWHSDIERRTVYVPLNDERLVQ